MSKKAYANFDGFVGWRGQAMQMIAGSAWDIDHDFVQGNPDKFVFPEGGEPEPVVVLADDGVDAGAADVIDQGDDLPPYIEWKLADLQQECRDRQLTSSGTKAELAARLDAWDAEHPDA
jgi:hypothetical protein